MTLKQYIGVFFMGTAFSTAAWLVILLNMNPLYGGTASAVLFYITFAIMLGGWFTVLGTTMRAMRKHRLPLGTLIKTSLRQAILLTILVVGGLLLQQLAILTWWILLIAIIIISLIEFFAFEHPELEKESFAK